MIIVCGESLIDLFVSEAEPAATKLNALAVAGGSPFNVAVGLARLGAAAGYLGGVGQDAFGAFLLARLAAEGVDVSLVQRSARPTPLAVVSPGPDGQPSYTFHAEGSAYLDVRVGALPRALPDEVSALAFGSFAISGEPVGGALLALAEREAGRRVISLDPNLRLSLAGDLASWRERIARLARCATVVKLSLEDMRLGWGEGSDPAAHAAGWLAGGVKLVVLTCGAEGASAWRAGGRIDVPGRAVDVVDTVGAGDSFHAALLSGLVGRGCRRPADVAALDVETLASLLRRAVLASSVTCTRRGADLPTEDDLRAADVPRR